MSVCEAGDPRSSAGGSEPGNRSVVIIQHSHGVIDPHAGAAENGPDRERTDP
jgi:hypothetical protein